MKKISTLYSPSTGAIKLDKAAHTRIEGPKPSTIARLRLLARAAYTTPKMMNMPLIVLN